MTIASPLYPICALLRTQTKLPVVFVRRNGKVVRSSVVRT